MRVIEQKHEHLIEKYATGCGHCSSSLKSSKADIRSNPFCGDWAAGHVSCPVCSKLYSLTN